MDCSEVEAALYSYGEVCKLINVSLEIEHYHRIRQLSTSDAIGLVPKTRKSKHGGKQTKQELKQSFLRHLVGQQ